MLNMKFCSDCGTLVQLRVPAGDNRLRSVCDACGTIHYRNPRMVVGTIPVWNDQVLLCRRAIEPRYGYWTLPAGFLELGESTGEGACRETVEEAGALIELGSAFSMIDIPHVEQVHLFYSARLLDLEFAPGIESLEVRLFSESEIPWPDLSFRTVAQTLRWHFENQRHPAAGLRVGVISPPPAMNTAQTTG